MKRTMVFQLALVWALVGVAQARTTYVLLSEDFDGLVLGPNVDEALAGDSVWTKTAPPGWTIDDSGVPGAGNTTQDGVTEWAGWSFADRTWWATTAADQNRTQFTKGTGTVAIADPDEWDDIAHAAGQYNTYLSTPAIDISSARPGTLILTFDSSWRPEYADYGRQTGNLRVSFDGGEPKELFRWESNPASANYKADATNETVSLEVIAPAGARAMVLTWGLFDCGNNWWWAIDNILVTGEYSGARASNPSPAHGAEEVAAKTILSWTPGVYSGGSSPKHRVLLSDEFRAVDDGTAVVSAQDANSYDAAGRLSFGTTYYWRVDEANGVSGWDQGTVWSFATESYGYPVKPVKATASSSFAATMGPEKTIDGSGLDAMDQHGVSASQMWLSKKNVSPIWIQYEFDRVYKFYQMWVWNSNQQVETISGFGAKDVAIQTSVDGTTWTALAGVPEFADATGEPNYVHNTTVDFGGALAKYVKLNIAANWADGTKQAGLSEVRFFYVPVRARAPQPPSAASGVALDAALTWHPGREAAKHQLYLSSDANAVTHGTAAAKTLTEPSFNLTALDLGYGRTYYWKVDEVNEAANPTSWEGDLWSFSTPAYGAVDDFESYNDTCKRVFFAWLDGFGYSASADCGLAASAGNGTGSTVGNTNPPFSERMIVHGGSKSMPMWFDNTKGPFYSEALHEWQTPQAWSTGGSNTLVVYLRGDAAAFVETSPGTVIMNGTGTDIWTNSDQFRFAYKSLKGNGSIVAKLESVTNTHEWAKAGVMIRESVASGSPHAFVAVTPTATHGVSYQCRPTMDGTSESADVASTPLPQWVKVSRNGNSLTAQCSADGETWKDIVPTNPVTIAMANDVFIGLAVTSHAAGVVCGAKFSGVSTTGNVSGQWQVAEVGTSQVAGNPFEAFYAAVEDSAGRAKAVQSTDPTQIATGAWQEVQIPLTDFSSAGVDLSHIKKLYLGIGDRNSPKVGGVGKVYIDDIRLQP